MVLDVVGEDVAMEEREQEEAQREDGGRTIVFAFGSVGRLDAM
jgi:hypothetical protein